MEKGDLALAGQTAVPGFAEEGLKHLIGLLVPALKLLNFTDKKRFVFPARSESVGSFQHGEGITTVSFPVFQFFVLSSGFLLLQKAQMLVAL